MIEGFMVKIEKEGWLNVLEFARKKLL